MRLLLIGDFICILLALTVSANEGAVAAAVRTGEEEIWFQQGLLRLTQNDAKGAIEAFSKAIPMGEARAETIDVEVFLMRATAWIKVGRLDEGRLDLTAADQALERKLSHLNSWEIKNAEKAKWQQLRELVAATLDLETGRLRVAQGRFEAIAGEPVPLRDNLTLRSAAHELSSELRNYELALSLGYYYNSNVSRTQRLYLNRDFLFVYKDHPPADAPLPNRHPENADSAFYFELYGAYRLFQSPTLEVGIQTTEYLETHLDLTRFDIDSFEVGPYVDYRLTPWLHLGARVDINHVQEGGDPILNRVIVTPSLTVIEPSIGFTTILWQWQERDFRYPEDRIVLPRTGQSIRNRAYDGDGENSALGVIQHLDWWSASPYPQKPIQIEIIYAYENQHVPYGIVVNYHDDGPPTESHVAALRGFSHFGAVALSIPISERFSLDLSESVSYKRNSHDRDGNQYTYDRVTTLGLVQQVDVGLSIQYFFSFGHQSAPPNRRSLEFDYQLLGVSLVWQL